MIGTALTEVAVDRGTEVYAIVRPNTKRMERLPQSSLVHTIEGTIDTLSKIKGLSTDCDAFYHFGWAGTSKEERDDPLIHEVNIKYTLDAVELAHRCGCRKFIGAGSQAEYGPTNGVINESIRCAPVTSYGVSKLAAGILSEKMCSKYDITHIWGRIFSVYGPHDNEGTMLNYAIDHFCKGEKADFSAATQMWNYLYESDAGRYFYELGQNKVSSGIYNVANPKSVPLRDYIETMISVAEKQFGLRTEYCFAELGNNMKPGGLFADTEKLMKAVDIGNIVSFEEGIGKMIEAKLAEKSQNGGGYRTLLSY